MAVGVFGLQVAYKLKRTELLSLEDTHGWFGGGFSSPTTRSTVDRIDFSNDTSTASTKGSLSVGRRSLSATGNSNYGWFGGGWFSPSTPQINYSTVDRVDFSNDNATASVRGSLSAARYSMGATGNSNYGWFGGGQLFDPVTPSNTPKSSVDRIDFSNDLSTASPRGPLSLARYNVVATGNSNYGWFGGGYNPGNIFRSTVDRIDFSNDSATASARGSLTLARRDLAATGNSNYGWFGGGITAPAFHSTVDRIDFANDSATALIRGSLSANKSRATAVGNSNYGWFGGGSSTVDRIDFSNDSATATARGPLSLARENLGGTSGQAKSSSIRLQKAGNFGWFGGGIIPAFPSLSGLRSTVDRIDFSNDSVTTSVRGPLSLARYGLAATGNSNYGWFGSGINSTPARVTTVDRIDFSNDSATASVRGPLSLVRYGLAATGNSNYGWFGGGNGSVPGSSPFVWVSNVNRINFSNDSATASVRGALSAARYALAATGNSNYGWFGAGYNPAIGSFPNNILSTVDRADFSNDSVTASPRGPLSAAKYLLGATGNSNYGWFGGGSTPSTTSSTVDRIDFSNDSSTASVRGPLSSVRRRVCATGNPNYGWFGGGGTPTYVSTVDRINFANDSVTTSVRGPLSLTKYDSAATSNTPVG